MYFWDIENKKAYNNKMGRYKTESEYRFIDKYCRPASNVLDIGGGSGRFSIPLHDNGHRVIVIDKNIEALDILHDRRPEIISINSDFFDFNFDNNEKFDVILAIEMLLYVKDWPGFFNKVNAALADDGVFIFSATNKSSWRTIVQKQIDRVRNAGNHEYSIFSPKEYEQIIHRCSFTIEDVSGFSWVPCRLDSNSRFVEVFAFLEKSFLLDRYVEQSPWLMYAVKKIGTHNAVSRGRLVFSCW
jgi:2-polyprenyl-3-methyl-5-hydroxy-6-metoxy-1,4-benzoquinol methylase